MIEFNINEGVMGGMIVKNKIIHSALSLRS